MQKLTHMLEWEPINGNYRILTITGSQRQPTMAEAREYMNRNNLQEGLWVAAFNYNGDWVDISEFKSLELYEYTGFGDGSCPVCGKAAEWAKEYKVCPTCGKEW